MKAHRRFIFVSAALLALTALANVSSPAQAASIVYNGGFDSGAVGWPTGSTQHNMTGSTVNGQTALSVSNTLSDNNFQVVDAAHLGDGALYTLNNSLGQATAAMPANENGSANPNWNPSGTSLNYSFTYQYDITGASKEEVLLYYYNGVGRPAYDVNNRASYYQPGQAYAPISSTGWVLLYDSGALSTTTGWNNGSTAGTISGIDPEYFAIVLDKNGSASGVCAFDSITLDTQSNVPAPVPEPGTMMLLGVGFLGLAVYGKRRKNA